MNRRTFLYAAAAGSWTALRAPRTVAAAEYDLVSRQRLVTRGVVIEGKRVV